MRLHSGGLIIGTVIASVIWGAYFRVCLGGLIIGTLRYFRIFVQGLDGFLLFRQKLCWAIPDVKSVLFLIINPLIRGETNLPNIMLQTDLICYF